MAIWHHSFSVQEANALCAHTAMEHLGVEITAIGDDHISGRMPVDHRTHQPMGLLHGGASVLLAETLASLGATGVVTGTARPLHLGRTSQVWDVRLVDEAGKLVCVSRVTMAVLARPTAG